MTRFCWRCGQPLPAVPPTRCAACGESHYVNPKLCGNALVLDGDRERVLLLRRARDPDAGAWTIPGGFCEDGEHPRLAAERELFEETGARGVAVAYLGVWMDVYGPPAPDGLQITCAVSGYLCSLLDDSAAAVLRPSPDEVLDVGWFGFDELPAPIAFPAHIPAMLAAGRTLVEAASAGAGWPVMLDASARAGRG